MPPKLKVLFMGTTDFAKAMLEQLMAMNDFFTIAAVISQPDRNRDRKKRIIFGPVKELALTNNLTLYQPEKIISIYDELALLQCDLIITCAYGQFLPSKILALPKIVPLNIHASLLPKLRGGAPIHWAIINNECETGITLMEMIPKMDAGAIFVQAAIPIAVDETYSSLKLKLIVLAQQLLKDNLIKIANRTIIPVLQDEAAVTFGYNINRKDELIDWKQSATKISCHIRGLYDNPIAFTLLNDAIYKIHEAVISAEQTRLKPGTISKIDQNGIHVATLDYLIVIKKIQPAGKKVIVASNYYGSKQNPLHVGAIFAHKFK